MAWILTGNAVPSYTMSATGSALSKEGATMTLQSSIAQPGKFGATAAVLDADAYRGRLLTLSATIEARDVTSMASLWLRADSGPRSLVLENGQDNPVKGTATEKRAVR